MNDSLSIGIVCYPTLGGSGVIAGEIAAGLAQRGHRIHLISAAPPSRTLPASDRLFFHEVSAADYPVFEHPPYEVALAATIVAVANEHRLDLVHAHYAVPHAASVYLARQVLQENAPRAVVTLHGTDVTRIGVDPRYRTITRFTVAAADGLTVPSQFLRREAYRLLELPGERPIEVVPNFVDTDHFAPPGRRERSRLKELFSTAAAAQNDDEGPILFHVSNFRPVKRPAELIEVLARVRRSTPARLVLVGDGPERARAAQRADELGVTSAVCFLGNRTDFSEYLGHADAFLLTSESESFGVAALEALSAGVPVLAYRVGGLPEVVNDGVGRLVDPGDVDALATAALEVTGDGNQREALGRAARAHALAHFRPEPALDRYEDLYRRVLNASTRASR